MQLAMNLQRLPVACTKFAVTAWSHGVADQLQCRTKISEYGEHASVVVGELVQIDDDCSDAARDGITVSA
jgi:hypothetical protein